MGRTVILATLLLAACAKPPHPVYEYETGYEGPGVASPQALEQELHDYAALVCGGRGYDVLDQVFVGEAGPSYARFRFACT
jgi:hypothetical protein